MTFDWLRRRVATKPGADPALAGESKRAKDNELDQRLEQALAQHQETQAMLEARGERDELEQAQTITQAITQHRQTADMLAAMDAATPVRDPHAKRLAVLVHRRFGGGIAEIKTYAPRGDLPLGFYARDLDVETVYVRDGFSDEILLHELVHHAQPEWPEREVRRVTRELVVELSEPAQPMTHPIDAASTPAPANKRVAEWG